jgi:hypothetical protein
VPPSSKCVIEFCERRLLRVEQHSLILAADHRETFRRSAATARAVFPKLARLP